MILILYFIQIDEEIQGDRGPAGQSGDKARQSGDKARQSGDKARQSGDKARQSGAYAARDKSARKRESLMNLYKRQTQVVLAKEFGWCLSFLSIPITMFIHSPLKMMQG
jgi:hypothetical protein